jgi:hypothetical protein
VPATSLQSALAAAAPDTMAFELMTYLPASGIVRLTIVVPMPGIAIGPPRNRA